MGAVPGETEGDKCSYSGAVSGGGFVGAGGHCGYYELAGGYGYCE